jgi:outer membrane receptor for ferrienterochelin and colicins
LQLKLTGKLKHLILAVMLMLWKAATSQCSSLSGKIMSENEPASYAQIGLVKAGKGTVSDHQGNFSMEAPATGSDTLKVYAIGFETWSCAVKLNGQPIDLGTILLTPALTLSGEITISGTMQVVSKLESIVPVDVYGRNQLKKNPVCNAFESLQQINGVRPQVNCNICSTGDIHINGLEGPYTMMLIDGMPIVSSLSTVYGFSGIPSSVIERIEVVKGPAGALYGSEAMGGIINIITQSPGKEPKISLDLMSNSWMQHNADISSTYGIGEKLSMLTSVNVFQFNQTIDDNEDNFTDIPLQKRISIFHKMNLERPGKRQFQVAARYLYEDRFGGELNWKPEHRGGTEVYGESIYTSRTEIIGQYDFPIPEKMMLQFSFNDHRQDSYYGNTSFQAKQNVIFSQLLHSKQIRNHQILSGIVGRLDYYDDNTVATNFESNEGSAHGPFTWMPAAFIQDEITSNDRHKTLAGLRLEHHPQHGLIFTPRIGHRWQAGRAHLFRLNAGKGFRVVNVFTEDHAALTGARKVIIEESLLPENSWNGNINYHYQWRNVSGNNFNADITVFYSRFANRIVADYETNADQIIYRNINGMATNKGISMQLEATMGNNFTCMTGVTLIDNLIHDEETTRRPLLTERASGVWSMTYRLHRLGLSIDYTGNLYGPMQLPLAGELDPRPGTSPWWHIHNLQMRWQKNRSPEIYFGVKNIFDLTPADITPFLIARAHDPFDSQVTFDPQGNALPTAENPHALTFDPTYVFAPNMGIHFFLGIRYEIR